MTSGPQICPRFDACDPGCGSRKTLGHLDEVFRFCTSDYETCPVYAGSRHTLGSAEHGTPVRRDIGIGQIGIGQIGIGESGADTSPAGFARGGRHAFGRCEGPLADEFIPSGAVRGILAEAVELTVRGIRILADHADGSEGHCGGDAGLRPAAP